MNAFEELSALAKANPALVFANDGYENLPPEIVAENRDAITQIESILKLHVKGFVRFQNFKPRKDGSTAARYQVHYNDDGSFTGVAYTDLEAFKPAAS